MSDELRTIFRMGAMAGAVAAVVLFPGPLLSFRTVVVVTGGGLAGGVCALAVVELVVRAMGRFDRRSR